MKESGGFEGQERRDRNQEIDAGSQPFEELGRRYQDFKHSSLYPQPLAVQECEQSEVNRQGIELASQERKCRCDNSNRGESSSKKKVRLVTVKYAQQITGSNMRIDHRHGSGY